MTTRTGKRRASALRMSTFAELRKRQWQPREFVIGPWLRQGESAMLWAPVGLGKTMAALTLALAVAGGGSVCGWTAPKPRPVLYLDGEMHIQDLYERLEMLAPTIEGLDAEAVLRNLVVLSRTDQDADARFPDLATPDGQDAVLSRAAGMRAEWVICDNFSTLAEVADENEAAAMTPVLTFLMRAKQAGIATMLVHHSDKTGSNYRGSSKLATTFEVIIGLHRLDGRATADGAGFELRWGKYRGKPSAATRDLEVTLEETEAGPRWKHGPASSCEMLALLDAVRSCRHTTQDAIAAELGWGKDKVSKLKGRAIGRGEITAVEWRVCMEGSGGPDGGDF